MNRAEIRAIVRRLLTPEESAEISDIEVNAIINHGIVDMSRKIGGLYTTASLNMATNADGTVSLPDGLLQIKEIRYSGERMGRIDVDRIQDLDDTDDATGCDTGSYYYMRGRAEIGTWKPVTSGTLTIYYEGAYTTTGIADADANLSIPVDWEEAIVQYVNWKVFERLPEKMLRTQYHERNYLAAIKDARRIEERHSGNRTYEETTQF